MCGHCKGDEASVCEECGVLVADGYQVVHKRQHPHPYDESPYTGWESHPERHGCVVCRLPGDASVHTVSPDAPEVLGRAKPDRPSGW